jgi:hypothetical protein
VMMVCAGSPRAESTVRIAFPKSDDCLTIQC